MKNKKYMLQYFINKFTRIPKREWGTGQFMDNNGKCCALGHLGMRSDHSTPEAKALIKLLPNVGPINDGDHRVYSWDRAGMQDPRKRVLTALKDKLARQKRKKAA